MKRFFIVLFSASFLFVSCEKNYEEDRSDTALERLLKGNKRFSSNKSVHVKRSEESRLKGAFSKEPFAMVITCSDPRIAPEILFDQPLGDLFVVRTAGGVICASQMNTVHYGATHFDTRVILVLGIENCGAVKAVIQGKDKKLPHLSKKIRPAVEEAKKQKSSEPLKLAIQQNAWNIKKQIESDPMIKELIEKNKLDVEAGYYDLKTGKVTILEKAPISSKEED